MLEKMLSVNRRISKLEEEKNKIKHKAKSKAQKFFNFVLMILFIDCFFLMHNKYPRKLKSKLN